MQFKNSSDPLIVSLTLPVASRATAAPAAMAMRIYVAAVIKIAQIVPLGIDIDGSY